MADKGLRVRTVDRKETKGKKGYLEDTSFQLSELQETSSKVGEREP